MQKLGGLGLREIDLRGNGRWIKADVVRHKGDVRGIER
ncbi:hypothetical protein DZE40_002629 [Clostridium beijerinckii]|nr:hypothetical protein [Clostridium beijerinckii]